MSIAIFAMRKAYLTLKISNINFKLMQLMQQQSTLSNYGNQLGIHQNQAEGELSLAQMSKNPQAYNMAQYKKQGNMMAQFDLKKRSDGVDILKSRLESQLKMAMNELQSVEKGEDAAIKRGIAKYA